MVKGWRIGKRKIRGIYIALCMVLCFFTHETAYAADELTSTATGPAIKVTTKNADDAKSYDIKVEWGDMQFVYDYAVPQWDTETLTYLETSEEGWVESGFNGRNNKIKIENRSNAEITVELMVELYDGVFNGEYTDDGVQAYFFDTNAHAIQASKVLTDVYETEFEGQITELILESAEEIVDDEGTVIKQAGVRTETAYFAFCGTPDRSLDKGTEVGTISLVFTDTSD